MSKLADQGYLRSQQYHDATKFDARVALHKRYSTNPYGWLPWVFDQLHHSLPTTCRVLEVGCGPGYLWTENIGRIPLGWNVTLADFSPGMIHQAQENLGAISHHFTFEVGDVQSLPFPNRSFDAVIANHMLYHVPDRERAYAEIKRVLRPQGYFFAATNGANHMRELDQVTALLDTRTTRWDGVPSISFRLENGADELARWFEKVDLRRYSDGLIVDDAELLVGYILSMADPGQLAAAEQAAMVSRVADHIAEHGAMRITKDAGLFVAVRDAAVG